MKRISLVLALFLVAAVAAIAAPPARGYAPSDLAPTSVCRVGGKTQMLCLHNYTRRVHGLQLLVAQPALYTAAGKKADRIDACGVFTHYPCGEDAFEFFPKGFVTSGENAAYGFSTIRQTYIAWLNSPGHYANIVNPAFNRFGSALRNTTAFPYLWITDFTGVVQP